MNEDGGCGDDGGVISVTCETVGIDDDGGGGGD